MYLEHFKLNADPFSLSPDPSFLYLSPVHAEALAALTIGLQCRRGLIAMTGEVGTGKTTLLYSLLHQLEPTCETAYLSNTTLPFDDLLRQALSDFGVEPRSDDRAGLLDALKDFLFSCAESETSAVLVVDEAQNLNDDTFESLRLLSNFAFDRRLLQIVLVGQPELDEKLRQPHLRQIAERVAVRCHVNPLSKIESRKFIEHRLECSGGSTELFTRRALDILIKNSGGYPRRLNILCHNALLFAFGNGETYVTPQVARTAVSRWRGDGLQTMHNPSDAPSFPFLHRSLARHWLGILVLALLATGFFMTATPALNDPPHYAFEGRDSESHRNSSDTFVAQSEPEQRDE